MNKTYYVCKYTPIELLAAFGADCENLNTMPHSFLKAERITHPNLCGFGKAVIEAVLSGEVKELVLVNCCDTIRSVYDILSDTGCLDFLWLMDLPHCADSCGKKSLQLAIHQLASSYSSYKGTSFDESLFRSAFSSHRNSGGAYISVLGARMGDELFRMVQKIMPLPVRNCTCVNNRSLSPLPSQDKSDFDELMDRYARELLAQIPCMRMTDNTGRKMLLSDPNLKGIIYHTVKFCDFYSFEYAQLKNNAEVPLLKIESDYTVQSGGQLLTRLEAFAEGISSDKEEIKVENSGNGYFAGIDSGSASTDVVILNRDLKLIAAVILPTGAGAASGAERALTEALNEAGLSREDINVTVTTGYGRSAIKHGDKSITEITCHARGAHFLDPSVRTVIDIGGQDSKVISLDENGNVLNFVMNDKCAAGTGRFLEMMARTMELSLDEMSVTGLKWKEDITISSMCTVFAESEVVSLIARNKATDDIVHGLNKAVAWKTSSLAKRAGGCAPYMMTGGVSKNAGLVKTLEDCLETKLIISEQAQLCGALGAALFAADMSL